MEAFRLSDFFYDLPDELIAQAPLAARSDSRLMVVDGRVGKASDTENSESQAVQHLSVRDLPRLLKKGDHLVFNNTRVIPARLYGAKASGGKLEMMLERVTSRGSVLAKIRASKSPKPGSIIVLSGRDTQSADCPHCEARVVGRQDDLFELEAVDNSNDVLTRFIEAQGEIPLPPYIERAPDAADDERYQTVFAKSPGAVAAPTAGLHFDEDLLQALSAAGITHSFITLHVGAGTFQPVRVENPAEHVMHAERVTVDAATVAEIQAAKARGGRIVAVGTTSVRALEAAAAETGVLAPFNGETRLFLVPGAKFYVVDAMVTNFHLPESTLLMLVASFTGLDTIMQAYRMAVLERYRFFSYGDAMLVWPKIS
ncbi:tRNA preQ1(34) S-adenosylmethionine ribosyltransferase-isomerase QueA [Granulosicoccus antarcticus]|uniref:tRNA preQ1(34) S-adenosylmethionine ribosyltransferase-isomerase QueA n=1 Tax=Granulosicoccus antarcticus TaxID=437505 RepID=UPI000B5A5223|nr:tRNA preQ1(34) S-adenosylmethionine ribosyltransferase-isomerase QueA [Granulosicoccus antarcticus]